MMVAKERILIDLVCIRTKGGGKSDFLVGDWLKVDGQRPETKMSE
jgi:hypothetical protein